MPLQSRTLDKLLREGFPGANPLIVGPSDRNKITDELKARLDRLQGVDTNYRGWIPEEDKPGLVCSFSITDPGTDHYYRSAVSFRVSLNDQGMLTIKDNHRSYLARKGAVQAIVSDLDEVIQFVRECKQRLERQKALGAKRIKVRELYAHAILAHVRKLAKEQQFDFMSETDPQKLNLYVKLSDKDAVVLHIPFKHFKEFLGRLGKAIAALRELYQSGIRFRLVGRLPRRLSWVTHQSL